MIIKITIIILIANGLYTVDPFPSIDPFDFIITTPTPQDNPR